MRTSSIVIIIALIILLAGVLIVGLNDITGQGPGKGPAVACTEEALLCPDGTAVGRAGPECRFSACGGGGPIEGELSQDAAGFRLITQAPTGTPGATYAMPLIVSSSTAGALLGARVSVTGAFAEGNTFAVASMTPAVEADAHQGVLAVGKTALIDGVSVTLNSVVQDSRCPVDVECIEAGAITANVTLVSDTDSETFNMPSDEVPHPFDSFQVSIVKIAPDRVSARETAQDEYRITFRVDPLGE